MAASFNFLQLSPTLAADDLPVVLARAVATPGVSAVTLAPVLVARASQILARLGAPGVSLCTPISFPHGLSKSTVKAIEATSSLKDGATELLVAPHFPLLLSGD